MGKIPEYQRTSFASQVQTSMIGQNPVLESVEKLANAGYEIAQKQQRIQNESYLAKQSIALEGETDKIYKQWQTEFQDDPIGKEDILQSRLSKARDDMMAQAPTGTAQAEFGTVADKYHLQISQHANQWQDQQLRLNTEADAQKSLDALSVKILRNPNAANFETVMQEGDMALSPLREASGAKVYEATREKFKGQLSMTMFQSLVEKNNLGMASQMLESRQYDQALGADGIMRVKQLIDIRQRQNAEQSKKFQEMKFKSPWDYYMHQGGTPNAIAFDPGQDPSGNMLKDSLLQRQSIVMDAKSKYGIELPIFTPNEADGLIRQMKAFGNKQTLDFFSFYDRNITDDQKIEISRQVFEKEPSMGIALSISNDAPEDAQRIITGTKLLRDDPSKVRAVFTPKSGQQDMAATFDTYIGNATEDADYRRQLRDAAAAHYTTMALRSNKAVTDFDPELYKQSVAAVSAPVFDHNGRSVFSFRDKSGKFVSQDEFEDFTSEVDDQMVEKFQGDVPRNMRGEPIIMGKAGNQISYVPTQHGKYVVLFQGQATVDKNKNPFVIDMKNLYDNAPRKVPWYKVWE